MDELHRMAIESDIAMADDILLAVQEHFSHAHKPWHECNCADRLRVARGLLVEARTLAEKPAGWPPASRAGSPGK